MVINNVTVTSRTPPHYVIVSLSPTQSGVVEKKHGVCPTQSGVVEKDHGG